MTCGPPEVLPGPWSERYLDDDAFIFPGAWIEQHLDDDEQVVDSTESPPNPNPASDEKRDDAIASHDPAASDQDRATKENKAPTGSQSDEMTEPPRDSSPNPNAMDVDERRNREAEADPQPGPPKKKSRMTKPLPESSLNSRSDAMDIDPVTPNQQADLDLFHSIKGMYRVLDLISESGSGGLVDKIIIAQESLKELINALSPGAYASVTKVDFNALDKLMLKPLGLYGSKSEIVAFLSSRGVINDETTRALSNSADNASVPHLRSGLYVLRTFHDGPGARLEQIFVIYWPEPTTWNDDAISSVRRNRVTFMRYLTKISDQVTCLISPEHARAIVWNEEAEEIQMDIEEGYDRLFTFEVAKTNEQDEDVAVRPGFTMNTHVLSVERLHVECTLDASELQPMLIHGEAAQAILTKHFVPSKYDERVFRGETNNAVQLRSLLANGSIRLGASLADDGIEILMENGLSTRFPAPFKAWKARNKAAEEAFEAEGRKEEQETKQKLTDESSQSEPMLREVIIDKLLLVYPTISRTTLSSSSDEDLELFRGQYANLIALHPKVEDEMEKATSVGDRPNQLRLSAKFKALKEQLLCLKALFRDLPGLDASDREHLIGHISKVGVDGLSAALKSRDSSKESKGWLSKITGWLSDGQSTNEQKIRRDVRDRLAVITDSQFLARLAEMLSREPLLQDIITRTIEEANSHLQSTVKTLLDRLIGKSILIQHDFFKAQIQRKFAGKLEEQRKNSRDQLNEEYEREIPASPRTLVLERIERCRQGSGSAFKISGTDESHTEPAVQCRLHMLHLTADDQHEIQLDSKFVPSPHLQASSVQVFHLPLGQRILHAQLLESGKLLLIVEDADVLYIFLESPVALDHALSRGRNSAKRVLHRDKIGKDVVLSYDEQKRMLSLCAVSKLQLHIYVFDETFSSLQAWGSALDLNPWYAAGTFVAQSCFVCGSEEILFVDTSGQARIFSLITQQFRPASLSLEQLPNGFHSSPDGACLVLSFRNGDQLSSRAYHWATFGSSAGIDLGALDLPTAMTVLTSFVNRRNVHLISIDIDAHACRSVVLDITKKTTEFMFKETGVKSLSKPKTVATSHNSLIDCFADVWTRFPVVAAVQRRTIVSSMDRSALKVVFVTDRDHDRFGPHFSELIYAFEQRTKKPTGDVLKNIQVLAFPSSASLFSEASLDDQWNLSKFRAGEWLVDLLCLIPIQIAVTRENRFLPLKDGVTSATLERSLLGAEVHQIVDTLSFGWYESVFQSYMTFKPVKVVSSMGEQSVGKSFSLNHLADTSFAGSAMRTTEGVWMSVTPTDDTLVVALDFEGVHSIERSAQEDTLLVLFNTAISNLVIFRNNFALSRSVAGLFQSFQSSSTVLDPAANPTLFRSTLTIVIKDVVESDKNEIVREFSTKFQKIVEDEQDANFISRLHAGQLNIVPWPVIESKQFYQLFPAMKRLLDKQEITHRTAGEFLHTLKTLMAKLKANDWGSISQTLVAHRAQKLLGGLSNALAYGFFEVEPDTEPLKNFDTDKLIEKPKTSAQFFLSTTDSPAAQRETMLFVLQDSWDHFTSRPYITETQWIQDLAAHLEGLAESRIQHVHEWISSNLSRFKTNNPNIEMLRRVFETTIVDLRANIEICGAECANCQLKCLLSRRHDSNTPHHCRTTHQCPHPCDFGEEHSTIEKMCGLPAGHAGRHICAVDIHLCGEPCQLKDKEGCLGGCMKIAGHVEGDHMCSVRLHKCGEPCDLKKIKLVTKLTLSMSVKHLRVLYPASSASVFVQILTIFMVSKLAPFIFAGKQTHNCSGSCQAAGICEIETAPQSIEATFTGRHETFQYTKYSQGNTYVMMAVVDKIMIPTVAKRLPCVFPIPPGERAHSGPHSHSSDTTPFHFCETRCESCGYFCTLPRGHPQKEHETSHGSMSKTRWAVDGPDGTALELNGRKFGSNDDGAPMMCNLVCQEMGRHAHLVYCRADDAAACGGKEIQHIKTRITPNPARAKDWITHSLFWKRSGFKDPYSRPDQANFSKCDAMCPDSEHAGTATNPPHPSYCMLPIFHPSATVAAGLGYLSNDGHVFNCKNPSVTQQAFHVIFVIDRSGSMGSSDRGPLQNAPGTALISRSSNNRLGAVYSALHGFWMSRNTALNNSGRSAAAPVRRDAYSVVLFDHTVSVCIANDFANTPDDLLNKLVVYRSGGGTDFTLALTTAQKLMQDHWSTERTPVVIFLSDGECSIADETVRGLCRKAVALGKPLSFHAVSFGAASQSSVLRRMAQLALEVQTNAPHDPLIPAESVINSSYSEALDTVRLAETFLGFAESLRKPRGALLKNTRCFAYVASRDLILTTTRLCIIVVPLAAKRVNTCMGTSRSSSKDTADQPKAFDIAVIGLEDVGYIIEEMPYGKHTFTLWDFSVQAQLEYTGMLTHSFLCSTHRPPRDFRRQKNLWLLAEELRKGGLYSTTHPILILANKMDKLDAMHVDEIYQALDIAGIAKWGRVITLKCVSTTSNEGMHEAMRWLGSAEGLPTSLSTLRTYGCWSFVFNTQDLRRVLFVIPNRGRQCITLTIIQDIAVVGLGDAGKTNLVNRLRPPRYLDFGEQTESLLEVTPTRGAAYTTAGDFPL
ncbi:VWFA domain-containing protein [Mycena venus]|uniref:VWFA domain-containing protein n=1 Tax=Mycena venus TaxID=2733690 RepID=A0A8H6YC24_9AGAR|nr:VWFA domain-containing protein [Mycena venus]